LVVTDGRALAAARRAVEREIDLVDRACSRFRPDSDLSRVNAHPGRPVRVDPVLIDALDLALRAARLTDGDVDPALGMAMELTGYDRDWKLMEAGMEAQRDTGTEARQEEAHRDTGTEDHRMEAQRDTGTEAQREEAQRDIGTEAQRKVTRESDAIAPGQRLRAVMRPGWQAIEIQRHRSTVTVPPGVKLDLGATAKAWAADRAAAHAHRASGVGVLVSLGGDVATAGDPPAGGWQVHVTDDHRAGLMAPGQRVAIRSGGLATSSVAVRRWRHGGVQMHHLIDPATGAPTCGPWRTVSVAAIDCADANIASTAALVRGERAAEWLSALGLPARLVGHDGEVRTVGSWPAQVEGVAAAHVEERASAHAEREAAAPVAGPASAPPGGLAA
jgi:FAD:protein FMN transferase